MVGRPRGSLISNSGYPYTSTYSFTRAAAAPAVNLTRASQTVFLSERGDERYNAVTMVDLRISRPIKFGTRQFNPQLDIFNIGNAATVVRYNPRLARPTCAGRRSWRGGLFESGSALTSERS